MTRPSTLFLLPPLLLGLVVPGSHVSAQADSVQVLARIEGRLPGSPFGAVSDVDTSEELQRVYVLDAMNGEVAVFSDTGEPVFHVGRRGAGPGELSSLVRSLFVWTDGSFGVADLGNQRVTQWDASGNYVRDWPISLQDGNPINWCAIEGGLIAEISPPISQVLHGASVHNRLVRFGPGDSAPQTIHVFEEVGPLVSFNSAGLPIARPLMETALWTADHRGRVLVGRSGEYEVIDISGVSDFKVSMDSPARPVSPWMEDQMRARFEEAAASLGQAVPEVEFPSHLPVIGNIISSASGVVLVHKREFTDFGSALPGGVGPLWDVISESGSHLGSLRLPSGFTLKGIVRGSLVGRMRDELDVPSVVILRHNTWEWGDSMEE